MTKTTDPAVLAGRNVVTVDFAAQPDTAVSAAVRPKAPLYEYYRHETLIAVQSKPRAAQLENHTVYGRLVPASEQAAKVNEMQAVQLMFDPRPGARAIEVANYDQMTYLMTLGIVVTELLTLSDKSNAHEYSFGLATGGTTESTRKLLGMLDKINDF